MYFIKALIITSFVTFLTSKEKVSTLVTNLTVPDSTIHKHIRKLPSPGEFKKLQKAYKKSDDDCIFTNEYTVKERLKQYPFSKASKVLAVSYDGTPEPNRDLIIGEDTTKNPKYKPHGLIMHNDTIDFSSLIERTKLTPQQIDRLTNIIYNTDYRKPYYNTESHGACFNPRNALIFYNKYGKVFDYIEICFECRNSESNSDRITIGESCNQKYDLLKKYFLSLGIKYGTIGH